MSFKDQISVGDCEPIVEMVTYPPDPPVVETPTVEAPAGTSPTEKSQDATVETTGADPPPEG